MKSIIPHRNIFYHLAYLNISDDSGLLQKLDDIIYSIILVFKHQYSINQQILFIALRFQIRSLSTILTCVMTENFFNAAKHYL